MGGQRLPARFVTQIILMSTRILLPLLAVTVLFAACEKDPEESPVPSPAGTMYDVPSTYTFSDSDGNSTVNFSGQYQRLDMLSEMTALMKTANTSGVSIAQDVLLEMYGNTYASWSDANNLGLVGSSKNLKSKTAAGSGTPDPTIQTAFEELMTNLTALSETTTTGNDAGGPGVAGVVVSTSNPSKQYLQDAEGHEYMQRIEKGLMGAVFYNQMLVVYLGEGKMNVDNAAPVDPGNGKFYTAMEHHWDEAFGYFTTATDYPENGTDRFWGKYAAGREDLLGSASALSQAFRTGRAAIANDDMAERDAQIAIIRNEMERVAAGTAIHYLNAAVTHFADDAMRNHALSEAWAFMEALPYGHDPVMNFNETQTLLAQMGSDFYAVTSANLIAVRDQLSQTFGLQDYAAVL